VDFAPELRPRRRVRTVWVSDVHLGTRGAQAGALLRFLDSYKFENLYLVGDIIDGWALRKSWYWDQAHNDLARRLLELAGQGVQVRLICGNHDEFLRQWIGFDLGGIRILEEAEHLTADGRRLLVLHGDRFDAVVRSAPWLAHLGDWAYRALLVVNAGFNWLRRRLGYPYWSLSLFLKQKVKSAVSYMESFEEAVAREARTRGYDGVVCGHIHKPEIRDVTGIAYHNCGDWVESCTALLEQSDGRIELAHWRDAPVAPRAAVPIAAARAAIGGTLA
jgi:UDP-2,3-diacylglucosamine pyrophosphatase LpxH